MKRRPSLRPRRFSRTPQSASARPRPLSFSLARLGTVAAVCAVLAGSPARAADFVWDSDAVLGAPIGGTGVWNDPMVWNNAGVLGSWVDGNRAIFGGTAGVVAVNSAVAANGLHFQTGGYRVAGPAGLTLIGPGAITVDRFAQVQIDAPLAGSAGLTKLGDGSLVLTNTGNSFTGDVVINGGSLVIGNDAQLGSGTTAISVNGIANTGNPGLSGGSLVVQGGSAGTTISREISIAGRGPFAANAAGGLISIGGNTFTNDILFGAPVSEGRLTATHGNTTLAGRVTIGAGGGTNVFTGNGNFIVEGRVTGLDATGDRLAKTGTVLATTLWLKNSANDFLQPIRIDFGTVRASSAGALGANAGTQAIDLNGGTLELLSDSTDYSSKNLRKRGNGGGIFVDHSLGGTLLNQNVTFGNLVLDANSTFNLSGRNGYGLTVGGAGGTINWSSGNPTTLNNNSSGKLTVNANLNRLSESTARTISFGGNGDIDLQGSLLQAGSGAVALSKNGRGTLTITGTASTATGSTTINDGTLVVSRMTSLPTGALSLGNGTTTSGAFAYNGSGESSGKAIAVNTTTVNNWLFANGSGALVLTGTITAATGNKTLFLGGTSTADNEIASALPSAGATMNVQKIGRGTWVLSGANAHTGATTVAGGTLKLKDTFGSSSRNILSNTAGVGFGVDAFTQGAAGTLEYLGDGAASSAEDVGALSVAAGAATVKVTAGSGGTAALAFGSFTVPGAGTGLNFVTNGGGAVTLGSAANVNGILDAHVYWNGADFASGSTVSAATYTVENTGTSLPGGNSLPYLISGTDIGAQGSATIQAGIKFADSRMLTLNPGATLTLQNGSGSVAGGILVAGGSAVTLSGGDGITSGGSADLVVRTDAANDVLALLTPILASTTGGLTKNGAGTLILAAPNANTAAGAVTINEGTVQLSGGGTLGAANVGLVIREAGTLDLNGVNVGSALADGVNAFTGAGRVTNSAAGGTALLRVGNAGASGYFTGLVEDGANAAVALSKGGSGTLSLTGLNTFTGPVTIAGGTLAVTSLGDIGASSALGRGLATSDATNAASLVFANGTLTYTGATATIFQAAQSPSIDTNRLFTLAGNGTISSEGSSGANFLGRTRNDAALVFRNPAPVAFGGAGTRTLTLQGDSLGDNRIDLQLVDNPNAGEALSVTKSGSGLWILGHSANSYSGSTTVNGGGVLRVGADDAAATRTLPQSSALVLGTTTSSGVLQTSGLFTRALAPTPTAGQLTFGGTSGGGGFAASTARLTVNLGGAGVPVQWASGGFVPNGGSLILNTSTSWADVDFQNPIDLNVTTGTVTRTLQVDDNGNTGLDFATISGAIGNSGAGTAAVSKTGGGTLILGDASTYNGHTTVTAGTLIVSSIGASGATATSVGTNVGGGNLLVGNGTTGGANLLYVGPGETTTRTVVMNTTTATPTIDASGSGALVLTSVTHGGGGAKTLSLRGVSTDANTITSQLGNNGGALSVTKSDGGVWILAPGGGANTFNGAINANGGMLGLTADGIGAATSVALNNGGIFAHGGPLATTVPVVLVNNSTAVFGGAENIVLNGSVTKQSGANDQTFSNNLEGGAVLTVNGDFINAQTASGTRVINVRGTGSTVWNGALQNNSATSLTRFDIRLADGASFTLGGNNSLTGGFLLGQGTLVVAHAAGLGPAANVVTLNGGTLTSTIPLTGVNAVQNRVVLSGDQVTVNGSEDIELAGNGGVALENSGGNRFLLNNLDDTRSLTISGQVNLTNDATARTLTLRGTGQTIITGVIANGGSGAGSLAFSGRGSLELQNTQTATGVLTVNRGTVILSGTNGSWNNGGFALNPTGTLRLDNSGGDNPAGRLSNSGSFAGNGGTLEILGDADGSVHTAGPLTLNSVQTYIKMTDNTGGSGTNSISFASVTAPSTGSSLNLVGVPNLGTVNQVKFGGPLPANFQINNVMPRTFIGNDFATYDVANGVMAFANYNPTSSTDLNLAAATDTVQVDGAMTTATLAFDKTINALKLSGTGLTVGGAGRTLTLAAGAILNTGGNNALNATLVNFGSNTGFIQVASGTTLTVNSTLLGTNGLAKSQPGTLVLNTPNFLTNTTNVLNGTLKLSGGLNTLFPNQFLNINDGATLDLNGNAQYVERLSDPGVLPGAGGTISNSGLATATLVTNLNPGSTVVATVIEGDVRFARLGGNTLTFQTPHTYTGSTTLMGGTTTLENDASILGSSAISIRNATLSLNNNSSLQTANYNRVGDAVPITLRDGTLSFTGKVSDASVEDLGALTAAQGANTVTVNTGGTGSAGAFASARVTFDSLMRSPRTTVNFTGTNLGSQGNSSQIHFDAPLTPVGGGLLGAWAIANTNDYAAYNTANGVGVVGSGGFTSYDPDFGSGKVTNLNATAALTTTLGPGTTTAALLRLAGGFTHAIEFTNPADTLHLELGGILRSNNNNATSIGTPTAPGVITSGLGELVVYTSQNVFTVHSRIDGPTALVKSGAGTLTLTHANTYTGGTTVAQGTLRLEGGLFSVVVPAGGLELHNATVTMVANSGQIHADNDVTLSGSSTLTLAGGLNADNTLKSVTFLNQAGTTNPTVTIPAGSVLNLTSGTPLSVSTQNALTIPTITGGALSFSPGESTLNVGAIEVDGVTYHAIRASMNIASPIVGAGISLKKTGAGLLQLSGQSTFTGAVDVAGGGLVLGASSTSTFPNSLTSGPLGTGAVAMAAGTALLVDDNSRTVANAVTFASNPRFSNVGASTDTLTLSGALAFDTLATSGLVVGIETPFLNVALNGPIAGLSSVVSVGGATGANTLTVSGYGNLTSLNFTGLGSSVPINIGELATGAFTLLHDGDGSADFETVQLGPVTWEPVNGALTLSVGRAGGGQFFPTPAFKTVALQSLNSSVLPNGMSVTALNGYGLVVPNAVALSTVAPDTGATFTVVNANTSLQVPGLTLSGLLSGGPSGATARTLIKAGTGTLVLGNAGNSFGGGGAIIDITDGILQVASNGALGDSGNVVRISANNAAEGLRVTETFDTSRTLNLNGANSGIDVTRGKTFTLNSAFTHAAADHALHKNDLGTLVLTQPQPGWDGVMNVNQGALRITDAGALGTTAGGTVIQNVGAALELPGGMTVQDGIRIASTNNSTSNGVNGGGAIRSTAGTNTLAGPVVIDTTTADSNHRAGVIVADSGSTLNVTGGVVLGLGTGGSNRDNWIAFGGGGTINVSGAGITRTGANGVASLVKTGSGTLNLQVSDAFPSQQVVIKQGTLSLHNAGTLGMTTLGTAPGAVYLNPTGVLEIDNTAANLDHRLSGRTLNVSGADVIVRGNSAAPSSETVGAFTLREGLSHFTLAPDAAQSLTFATGALTRSAGATMVVRGPGLGLAAAPGVATFLGNAYGFVGQLGGTDTATKGVLPWAFGDPSLSGNGTVFLTADSAAAGAHTGANRLRPLQAAEQVADLLTAGANASLDSLQAATAATSLNSLRLASGGGVTMRYAPLTLESGGLLALAGNGGISGTSGAAYLTTPSNREFVLHTVGDLALDLPLAGSTGALTKSGAGKLTLTGGSTNHGTVFVNDGTLELGGGDHTILPGRSLQLNEGGTLDLNGSVQQFNLLESRLTAVLARNDVFTASSGGTVLNSSATQATLALANGNVTFTGLIEGNVAVARGTAAANFNDWNLYSDLTYSGPTLLTGGRTQLVDAGRLSGTASIEIANATLLLGSNNSSAEFSETTDRVRDGAAISMRGAQLQVRARAGLYTTETLGAVVLAGGQSIIDVAEPGTRLNQTDVTIASLAQAPGSFATVRFFNIDATPNDDARLFLTTNPVLKNHLIGSWAVFEREFASYTPGQGVGGLNTQGFAGYAPRTINEALATDNVRIALPAAGSTTTLTADRTIHTLNLNGASSATDDSVLNLGGNTLTLDGGGLIVSGATDDRSISIINGRLTAGELHTGGALYLHTAGYVNGNTNVINRDVNIGADIIDHGFGPVTLVVNAGDGRGTGIAGALNAEATTLSGANTHTGGTFINAGRVILATPGANGSTITATGLGNLTIAGGMSTNGASYQESTTTVIEALPNQIANTATVTLLGGAQLNLNNNNDSFAALVFNNTGGHTPLVTTGTGTLTLSGGVTASGQNLGAVSQIDGKLNFTGMSATLHVDPVSWNGEVLNPLLPNLLINASISGADLVKTGAGLLRLSGSNAFSGNFTLQAGGVSFGSNNALSSGTLVLGDGTFLTSTADNRVLANNFTLLGNFALRDVFNLSLNGNGFLAGSEHAIAVDLATRTLTLGGILSGGGALVKTGDGILVLGNNSNSYAGETVVADGTLRYGAVDAVPTGSAVKVMAGGVLDITGGGAVVSLGSLAGNSSSQGGLVTTTATSGTVTLTVGGSDATTEFGGVIANAAGSTLQLVKTGTGTLTLGGANQYSGSTTIAAGRLIARAVGGSSPLGTSQAVIFGGGSTSGVLQLGDSSAPLNLTLTSLASSGSGTASRIVGGNAASSTVTLDVPTTSVFAGNLGGAGTNEGNLNVIKTGSGDLVVSGTGVSAYSGSTSVNGGKLFLDTPGAFPALSGSLALADGTEFSLRGTSGSGHQVYGFTGTGNRITVGTTTGAALGFGLEGAYNTRLNLSAGQTMTVNGALTTAVYVNGAPIGGQDYILIAGADPGSLHAGSGAFNVNPVIFNGGSFTYALRNETLGGTADQWVLTPTAVAAASDVWWKGDLTGIGTGVWSATTTAGPGAPSNWDTAPASGVDALVPPDSGSIVHFSATGAANFATTLGANLTIQELIFHSGSPAVSVGSSNGVNTLTLGNGTDPSGLLLESGAGDVSISAVVAVAQSQAWNVGSSAQSLTVSGGLNGAGTLTINNIPATPGRVVIAGGTGSFAGTIELHAGSLTFEDAGTLTAAADLVLGTASKAATLQLGGAAAATGATIGGLSNGSFAGSRVIGGNAAVSTLTLSPLSGTSTFTGALGGAGANENQFALVKAGAGTQVLAGPVTYAGATTVREGTLRLGTGTSFAPAGALSVIASASSAGAFDINGNAVTLAGDLTLGGGLSGAAQIADSAATRGAITLGGNIVFDGTNDPAAALISAHLIGSGGNRTITVGESVTATTDLTVSGNYTVTTDNSLTLAGPGNGEFSGDISIAPAGGANSTRDLNLNGTGTWTLSGKVEVGDDININSGVVIAATGESLDATDDVVLDGTGIPGSATVTIASAAQVHTGDDIFIRNGGRINVTVSGGLGVGTDQLLIGDSASTTVASAGVLNLGADISVGAGGFLLGNGTNIGFITGSGTITTAANKDLRNGSIDAGIVLAGNGAIFKQNTSTVTIYGERDAASTGSTNIREGTLVLDYSLNNNSKIGGALSLGFAGVGGNAALTLNGNASTGTVQSVASTVILPGSSSVVLNDAGGQNLTLALAAVSRTTPGGVVAFEYASPNVHATTTNAAGTLGWALVQVAGGGYRFATVNASGEIQQATATPQNDLTLWSAGQDVLTTGPLTGLAAPGTTLSSLTFGASGAATANIASDARLGITSGGILVSPTVGAFDVRLQGGEIYGASTGNLGELIVHQENPLGALTIASNLVNSAGVTKAGAGTLILSGSNTYLPSGSQVHVNEGIVQLGSANALGETTAIYLRSGASLNLANFNAVAGALLTGSSGTIALGTGDLTLNQAATVTTSTVFTGTAGSVLTLNGANQNFNINGSTTTGFTGTVVVNGGLLQLSGSAGRLSGVTSFTVNKGANFLVDNNDDNAPNDRLSDSAAIVLHSADGTFAGETRPRGLAIRTDNNGNEAETFGALTIGSGSNYASLEASGGTGAVAALISSGWTRHAGATLTVRGRNLGGTSAERTQFKIADANDATFMTNQLVGGPGVAGGMAKNVSIIPWAIGQNLTGSLADANMGNTLLTYVDNRGFVALDPINEFATLSAAAPAENARESLNATLTGVSGKTVNALVLHKNSTTAGTLSLTGNGAGEILTSTSGTFLFTVNPSAAASSAHGLVLGGFDGGVQTGGSEYLMFVVHPSSATNTPTLVAEIASPLNSVGASLVKSGRGTLELSAVNSFGGGTTINEGAVRIHDNDNVGSGLLTLAGGTLQLAADYSDDLASVPTSTIHLLNSGGAIDVLGSSATATNLAFSGPGTLAKIGTGTLQLAGSTGNAFAGDVAVLRGNLELNKTAGVHALGTGTLSVGGSTTTNDAATVTLLADEQIANGSVVNVRSLGTGAVGTLNVNGRTETIGGLALSTTTSSGVLVRIGAGGTLRVNGDIVLSNDRALADAGTNARNVVITATGTNATAATGGGTLDLGGVDRVVRVQTVTTTGGNNDATIEATIANGGLVKEGARRLVLTAANTYAGRTTINDGTLVISSSGNLGDGSATNAIAINHHATLQNTGANVDLGENRTVALGGIGGTFDVTGANQLVISGAISGAETALLSKTGPGTLSLAGANSYAGLTTIAAGTLRVGNGGTTGTLGSGAVRNEAVLAFDRTDTHPVSNAISGGGALSHQGTGTTILTGSNSYTGASTVNAGTLQFGTRSSLYEGDSLNWQPTKLVVNSGATAAFNVGGAGEFTAADLDLLATVGTGTGGFRSGSSLGIDTTNSSGTFAYGTAITNPNAGANSLGLVKSGSGTLALTATSTYTGPTDVRGGTLELTGRLDGTTLVEVDAGGTLLLHGAGERINNLASVVLNGGSLGFASSLSGVTETLSTLTLSANSVLDFGIGDANTFRFSSLTLGAFELSIYNWSGSAYNVPPESDHGGVQDRLLFGTSVAGEPLSQIRFFADNGATFLGTGAEITFGADYQVVPVPEPSSTALVGGAALVFLVGYRERRRIKERVSSRG